jgi:urease accessory protein UreF
LNFQQAQRRTELLEEQLERAHAGIHRKRQGAKERYTKAVERHEAVLEAQTEHEKGMEQQLNLKAHLASQIENAVEDYTRGMKKGQAVYDTIRTELCEFKIFLIFTSCQFLSY